MHLQKAKGEAEKTFVKQKSKGVLRLWLFAKRRKTELVLTLPRLMSVRVHALRVYTRMASRACYPPGRGRIHRLSRQRYTARTGLATGGITDCRLARFLLAD